MIVVSDASPIISLAAVRQFDLLHKLYAEIIIPDAVRDEIARGGLSAAGTSEIDTADWMLERTAKDRALGAALGLEEE